MLYFQIMVYIRVCRGFSIEENINPDVSQKICRMNKIIFSFYHCIGKVRSTAFKPCITLGGFHMVKMGDNNDFPKKVAKTLILEDIILERLTSHFECFHETLFHNASNEPLGKPLASKLSEQQIFTLL